MSLRTNKLTLQIWKHKILVATLHYVYIYVLSTYFIYQFYIRGKRQIGCSQGLTAQTVTQ